MLVSFSMPIPAQAVNTAQEVQRQAAHNGSSSLRLIAGPGTGKSSSIKQRVAWLLSNGQNPKRIFAVSFTRASAKDLELGIDSYCLSRGYQESSVVSTLHALALRLLSKANRLNRYPATPLIIDDWELENIFDLEFHKSYPPPDKDRRKAIRAFHEAYWSTGNHNPPSYLPPDPAITAAEQAAFNAIHLSRSLLYSCVLPGEIVRQCVTEIASGMIAPATLLDIEHLIVDEFQDLNPMDQELVDGIINDGANVFIAGDDDQSIYSFRHAYPSSIQQFSTTYPATTSFTLNECFRCMPEIMNTANTLIENFSSPQRIPKDMKALFRHCAPNARGTVKRWRFVDSRAEARAIAESCSRLITAGVPARAILILLSKKALMIELGPALESAGVAFDPIEQEHYRDTKAGRFVYALLRIVAKPNDYLAHRTILGIKPGVGINTAHQIAEDVILNSLNFRDLFYSPLPTGVFAGRALRAINDARTVIDVIRHWSEAETLGHRRSKIEGFISSTFGQDQLAEWQEFVADLPNAAPLKHVLTYVGVETDDQRFEVLRMIFEELGEVAPIPPTYQAGIRIMTMHGAKGLEARVVFIPGLEENALPGPRNLPYAGKVLESARLLYVSITRAQAACILSYANIRSINGSRTGQSASPFNGHLRGPFQQRSSGLDASEVQAILQDCAELLPMT